MSPRPRSERRPVGVRLSRPGYEVVARMAAEERVSVSEMIRVLLAEAVAARREVAR